MSFVARHIDISPWRTQWSWLSSRTTHHSTWLWQKASGRPWRRCRSPMTTRLTASWFRPTAHTTSLRARWAATTKLCLSSPKNPFLPPVRSINLIKFDFTCWINLIQRAKPEGDAKVRQDLFVFPYLYWHCSIFKDLLFWNYTNYCETAAWVIDRLSNGRRVAGSNSAPSSSVFVSLGKRLNTTNCSQWRMHLWQSADGPGGLWTPDSKVTNNAHYPFGQRHTPLAKLSENEWPLLSASGCQDNDRKVLYKCTPLVQLYSTHVWPLHLSLVAARGGFHSWLFLDLWTV